MKTLVRVFRICEKLLLNTGKIFVRSYRGEWVGGLSQKRTRAYRVGGLVKNVMIMGVQYPTKVLGHFALFAVCNKLSFPSPPETMLVFWRSTCDNGKISRARQLQMYHKRINIVLGGRGVHVCSNYDNM